MVNIGSIAPCGTYSVKYDSASQKYTVFGPTYYGGYYQTASYSGAPPSSNSFVLWGAVIQFDNNGNLIYADRGNVGTIFFSPIAHALESGAPVILQLNCLQTNVGTIAPCKPYTVRYNTATKEFKADGPVFPTNNFATGSYEGKLPSAGHIVVWGVNFNFDKSGNLLQGKKIVGVVTSGNFQPLVFQPSTSKYVETNIESRKICSDAVSWSTPKVGHLPELSVAQVFAPILRPDFKSELQLFGYNPSFNPGRVSFAPNGRPIIRDHKMNLQILSDQGHWQTISLFDVAKESLRRQGYNWTTSTKWPGSPLFGKSEERVVFDEQCNGYTIVDANRSSLGFPFLMHTSNGGHSWAAYPLKGMPYDSAVRMEVPSSPKATLSAPPAILYHQRALKAGSPNTLGLFYPQTNDVGTLSLRGPFIVATRTICCGGHSGFENQAISSGDLIHVVFPGDTPVKDSFGRSGTPQYAKSFSRSKNAIVSSSIFLGIGFNGPSDAPDKVGAIDDHNQTVIAKDSNGYLHVVLGGHGAMMKYRKSLVPGKIDQGWTNPETVGYIASHTMPHADEYTYPSLIIDSKNIPHVYARWSGSRYIFRLVHLSRNVDGSWSQNTLKDPVRQYYGVWYQKASIDPWGRIFISYSYYPDNLFNDEAISFARIWGFSLKLKDPDCPLMNVGLGSTYCAYSGYSDVGPAILMSPISGTPYQLTTTDTFFRFK